MFMPIPSFVTVTSLSLIEVLPFSGRERIESACPLKGRKNNVLNTTKGIRYFVTSQKVEVNTTFFEFSCILFIPYAIFSIWSLE